MLRFVLHKLISKKWLALCLLIGNILMVAVAASNPLYTEAILQRALTKHLSNQLLETNLHPAEVRMSRNDVYMKSTRDDYWQSIRDIEAMNQQLGLPVVTMLQERTYTVNKVMPLGVRSSGRYTILTLSALSDFENHAKVIAGEFMSDNADDGIIDAMISQVLQRRNDYLVGDEIELTNILQPNGNPYKLRIAGIYASAQAADVYWNGRSQNLCSNVVISEKVFDKLFAAYPGTCRRSYFLDFTAITPDNMNTIIEALSAANEKYEDDFYGYFTETITPLLEEFIPSATQFKATLLVLYAPIFALLAAFIFMVSRQLMDLEENEIAVIVSRGSRKWQIVMIYFLQAAFLSLLGGFLGYPLGFLLCQMLGSSNAFLEFIQRQALPLRISANSIGYAVAAAVICCGFMTLPVIRYANRSIVQYKVQKQAQNVVPFWQKIFLDVILLAVSLYALYSFSNQKAYLAEQVLRHGSLDPLLYFSSSLFIVGAGLLGIRLVPYIIRFIYTIGKRFWSPAFYTASLRVIRTRNQQSFIMLFMVLTIALGIFNAASARTINSNGENRIRYMDGADVVMQEAWYTLDEAGTVFTEPNYNKYTAMEGVNSITRVYYSEKATVSGDPKIGKIDNVTLMGIQTQEFGRTANFDTSLMPIHWFHYLNAMAQDPYGVLVSSNFRDTKGYALGDEICYQDNNGSMIEGIIYGFVDYWPSFSPTRHELTSTGDVIQTSNYLIVANLAQLQIVDGIRPYRIWINVDGSSQPVYDFIEAKHISLKYFQDTTADIIEMKNEPLFQGTNGILTANFIVVLLLCMVGFLIFWILSIRSRELQFGIFRAMGLSMGEVLRMLAAEQVMISGSAIAIGVVVGVLVTQLYLPLIQIAYSAADQVLPLTLTTETSDFIRLFAVIGFMVICCMAILAWLISKIRIAQALKLGED